MNLKSLALLSLSLLLLVSVSVSGAQPALRSARHLALQMEETPLIILMEGNLWIWEEMPARFDQLTTNGYNRQLVISPDGSRIAYAAIAEIGVAALESRQGQIGDAALPLDIWVLDLGSEQTARIAAQPAEASFLVEGKPDSYITRSAPTWSPDGGMLAWMEYNPTSVDRQLVVYDLATNSARTLVPRLPEQAGVAAITQPRWGSGGIAVQLTVLDAATNLFQEAFLVYDAGGAVKIDARHKSGEGGSVLDVLWAKGDAQDYIAAPLSSGAALLIDPVTGAIQTLSQPLEQYSLASTGASAALYFRQKFDQQAGLTFDWWYAAPTGESWQLPYHGGLSQVALSASSQTVAYVGEEGIYIWRGGQSGKIAGTETAGADPFAGVAWGATAWRISGATSEPQAGVPTATPAVVATQAPVPTPVGYSCPGSPPPRLTVGGKGRVTPGTPNRMRRDPGGRYLRDIPGGATFDVLEGPVCAENNTWWKVRYGGTEGWTVEGQGDSYWVEPVQP